MGPTIYNVENSFVTFYSLLTDAGRSEYITDTPCGIQNDFCLPIYDEKDIAFQTSFISSEYLTNTNVQAQIIINGTASTLNDVTTIVHEIGLYHGSIPIYNCYFNFYSSDLTANLNDGDCFQIGIVAGTNEQSYFISNQCFKKINDKCLTTKIKYINDRNAFGFNYYSYGTFPLIAVNHNIIRLPMYFKNPENASQKEVYVRSNGVRQLLSARISKKYKGFIDNVTEEVHQKLVIALSHDGVFMTTENFTEFQCTFEDEYNNNFPEIMQNVNTWSADFTIFKTPFNNFNSNCG